MKTGGTRWLSRSSAIALSTCSILAVPTAGLAQDPEAASGRTEAAESRRVSFAVPLVYGERVLGDVIIEVAPMRAPTLVEVNSLRLQLDGLLNTDGKIAVNDAIGGQAYVGLAALQDAGFSLRFNDDRLELELLSIPGEYRPVASLGREVSDGSGDDLPNIEPADFSAYLNVNTSFDYSDSQGADIPGFFAFGAARYRNVVLEFDGALTEQFGPNYRFFRRGVRAVYDDPENYRRYSAGDLRLSTIPLLRTPFIGGVALEKRRNIFNSFQAIPLLGGREIFLDSRSEVQVLVNGNQVQSLQLEAGRYDLSNLPLQLGSNNVEVLVTNSAGRRQAIDLDYFFEPLDLAVGEDEYVLSAGLIAEDINFEPEYSSDPVVTGFYRRALSDSLILGAAAELSEDLQVLAVEGTFVPQVVPGVFDVELATSVGDETGFAARAGYRVQGGDSLADRRQLSVTVDYESGEYRTIGNIFPSNFDLLTVTGSYTQAFSERTFANAGVVYSKRGGNRRNRKLAFVDVIHRLNDRVRLTAGVVYGEDEFTDTNIGVHLGLTVLFGQRTRLNADYRSRRSITRVTASRGASADVGSFGYDVGFTDNRGSTSANANATYAANRFEARGSFVTSGNGLGSITDERRARLQLGTSFAIADGNFGIGRPITDSFAVTTVHPSIKSQKAISGRNLSDNRYYARSGPLGGAVQSDLSSYSPQNIQYDLSGAGGGFAIGDGTVRVDPAFRSGYRIVVGDSRYVSAVGTLFVGGDPAALWAGTITSEDDEGFAPVPFFTNSVGRFGIIGLAPGRTYRVDVPREGKVFTIEVPDEPSGLYRVGTIDLPAENE